MIGRRPFLLGLPALGAMAAGAPRLGLAAGPPAGEARLVVVLLRGAMDGLEAVPPYGDPGLARLRGALAVAGPGQEGGALDLGGRFGLHPSLARLHGSFLAGEAIIFHAVAGHWRSRSHFAAQDMMETGGAARLPDGWLNRALRGVESASPLHGAVAMGWQTPLLLRGAAPAGSFSGTSLPRIAPAALATLTGWHEADPLLGPALAEAMRGRGYAGRVLRPEHLRELGTFTGLARAAGGLLAAPDGPRVAALELGGWDTHAGQGQRLAPLLASLDEGLAALRGALGAAWGRTAVLVMTEFGRTARMNGQAGTDHGTAGAAFVLGGAVRGGRVVADWPGLAEGQLFEGRDLTATLDIRRVAKALLAEHLGLGAEAVAAAFPDSEHETAMAGIVGG